MTYILTPALDAPDMLHLNPLTGKDGCGGRKWGTGDFADDVTWQVQEVDEKTALAMLDKGIAIACRRCDLKDRASQLVGIGQVDEVAAG